MTGQAYSTKFTNTPKRWPPTQALTPPFCRCCTRPTPGTTGRTRQPGIKLTRHWGHSGHWTICRHWLTGQSRARRWRTVSGGCTLTSGLKEKPWIPADRWDACGQAVDPEALRGRECYAGLDLSTTTDLSAFVLVFPDDNDPPEYDVLPFFWLPEARTTGDRQDAVDYRAWARAGHIKLLPGDVLDQRAIKADIQELAGMYRIKEIAFDRWNATQLAVELQEEGAAMVSTGMGYASLSAPSKTLEGWVLSGRIRHGGHPVLRWNMQNVTLEQDAAGNIKPSKARSKDRIDGAVALILAISRAMLREKKSVYRERGLVVI